MLLKDALIKLFKKIKDKLVCGKNSDNNTSNAYKY